MGSCTPLYTAVVAKLITFVVGQSDCAFSVYAIVEMFLLDHRIIYVITNTIYTYKTHFNYKTIHRALPK